MSIASLLRKMFLFLGVLLVALVAALAVAVIAEIPVNLNLIRGPFERAATWALGRQVTMANIELTLALQPTLVATDLRIGNRPGEQDSECARLESARVQFSLPRLLSGELEILQATAEDTTLALATHQYVPIDWCFKLIAELSAADSSFPEFEFIGLDDMRLHRVILTYDTAGAEPAYSMRLDEITGHAAANSPLLLTFQSTGERPFAGSLSGGALVELWRTQQTWPLTLTATAAGATLNLKGTLLGSFSGEWLDFALSVAGERLEELSALIGSPLPAVGAYTLSGRLSATDSGYGLSDLQVQVGQNTATGELMLEGGERLRLSGRLSAAGLDADLLQALPGGETFEGQFGQLDVDLSGHGVDLSALVDSLDWRFQISDAPLSFETEGQVLPLTIAAAEVTLAPNQALQATVTAALQNQPLEFRLSSSGLETRGNDTIWPFDLSGRSGGDHFRITGSFLADVPYPGGDLQLELAGQRFGDVALLLGIPLAAEAPYAVRAQLTRTETELRLSDLQAQVGRSTVTGNLSWSGVDGSEPLLQANLHAPILDLAELTSAPAETQVEAAADTDAGGLPQSEQPDVDPETAKAEEAGLELDRDGRQKAQATLKRLGFNPRGVDGIFGRNTRSAIRAFQQSRHDPPTGYLTAEQWAVLQDAARQSDAVDTPEIVDGVFDRPLLPSGVKFIDADLELTVDRVAMAASDVTELALSGRLRHGRMEMTTWQATLDGVPLSGRLALDLQGEIPALDLQLAAEPIDIGELLRQLGIAEDVNLRSEKLTADLKARGGTLRELLTHSTVGITLEQGRWSLDDSNLEGHPTIDLSRGTLQASPEQPLTLTVDGRFEDTPLKLALRSEPLTAFAAGADRWRLELSAQAAGAQLELTGAAILPLERTHLAAQLSLSGERLDHLNRLIDLELPPWGPYTFSGALNVAEAGYELVDLEARIANSDLRGDLSLLTAGEKPRLNVELRANALQLVDFGVDARILAAVTEATADEPTDEASGERDGVRGADIVPANDLESEQGAILSWLDPEFLGRFDARLSLQAEQLLLGQETLGLGKIVAVLENGRLVLRPLSLRQSDGSIEAELALQPSASEVAAEVKLFSDRYDHYGIVARQVNPKTDMGGLVSVDVALTSRAPTIDALVKNANGHLYFSFWPDDIEAGLLNLFELNLLTMLLPKWDSSDSKINCTLGRFRLEDGLATPELLLIDTSTVRIQGKGEVNFKTEQVDLILQPRVKQANILDLEPPVRVSGAFSDFGVGLDHKGLITTAARLGVEINALWLQLLYMSTDLPADGSDVCGTPEQRPPPGRPVSRQ